MILKDSISVVASRSSLIYKLSFFILIILLIVLALSLSAVYPTLKPITKNIADLEISQDVFQLVKDVVKGDTDAQQVSYAEVENDFEQLGNIIEKYATNFNWGIVLIVLFVFIGYFAVSMCNFPASDVLYNFMNSNSKFGFMSNFFLNLKISAKYAGLMTLISIPYAVISILALMLTWVVFAKISFLLALPVCVFVYLFLSSTKLSFLSNWIPNMVVGRKPLLQSFRESIVYGWKNYGRLMTNFFSVTFIYMGFAFVMTLGTLGFALLLLPSIKILIVRAIELVNYHHFYDLSYYTENKNFNKFNKLSE